MQEGLKAKHKDIKTPKNKRNGSIISVIIDTGALVPPAAMMSPRSQCCLSVLLYTYFRTLTKNVPRPLSP